MWMSILSQRGQNCLCSPQTIVRETQTRLAGACRELNCLRSTKHDYAVEKKYIEAVCMWKTNAKRCGSSVRKGHNMAELCAPLQWASKQDRKNTTESKQVNSPLKIGYAVFWSPLQWFCCLSLTKSLFTTGAIVVSARATRSVVQM